MKYILIDQQYPPQKGWCCADCHISVATDEAVLCDTCNGIFHDYCRMARRAEDQHLVFISHQGDDRGEMDDGTIYICIDCDAEGL